jgi:NAD(P)H-binding
LIANSKADPSPRSNNTKLFFGTQYRKMAQRLVILYGVGGLSDVGRHAVQVALLEHADVVSHVTVVAQAPHHLLLQEANWKCGCEQPHAIDVTNNERLTVVSVPSWQPQDADETLAECLRGATAVVTCLGNREAFRGHRDAAQGTKAVLRAMQKTKVKRLVTITSVGIEEDWPPLEFFRPAYYILSCLFMSVAKPNFRDLTEMERACKATDANAIDYLLVRPVGLGEDVKPVNKWLLQKKKYEDVLHFDMAKLDCARYMVEEAVRPTRHREAVVIGAELQD